MYARIARFEGGTIDAIVAEAEDLRRGFSAAGSGEKRRYFPKELTDRVGRMEMLVDRERGSIAILLYCDSLTDVREVDRVMDGMAPQREGWGKRVSSDVYEVVVDEAAGRRVA